MSPLLASSPRGAPPLPPPPPGEPLPRGLLRRVLRLYMRGWHGLSIEGLENAPPHGPAIALTNHASFLDVPAYMCVDLYPDTVIVAKASLFNIPLVRQGLALWNAIPVDRNGRDASGVRILLRALKQGRVVTLAAEGTRSRSGRLQDVNPTLARICVRAGVPLIPMAIQGSYDAWPPGAWFPRHRKLTIRIGPPFTLPRDTPTEDAAQRIRDAIAALLPLDRSSGSFPPHPDLERPTPWSHGGAR